MMRCFPALLWFAISASAAPPAVGKVEPPSWWVKSRHSPVRLLIRGQNLHRAELRAPAPLQIRNVSVNGGGTAVFADLDLTRASVTGGVILTLHTPEGSAPIPFEVLPALRAEDGFAGFDSDDFVYLIMPDRFANGDEKNDAPARSEGLSDRSRSRYYHGGDLQGIRQKLPYLKSLGVTAVWLNPWYDNANHLHPGETWKGENMTGYHGYGAVDFYGVDEHFGTLQTLQELVAEAHRGGIKMIQDQVANHTGPAHPWLADPPLPDWFHGTAKQHDTEDWQTWTLMDMHSSSEARRVTLDGWFGGILPDLNHASAEVRLYLIQNAIWWVGVLGLDGIRQDTLPYAPREFWAEWREALRREFPRLTVVGEVLDPNPALTAFFQGGVKRPDGVDSGIECLFDFPLHFAMRKSFARGESVREVSRALAHDWLYPDPSRLITLAGLHDVPRFMGEPGSTFAGLKLAFTFLFTSRGIPMVYYGDEIGMQGGDDPDNRRDFPGGWRTDAVNAFTPEGRSHQQQDVWNHVQTLAALRRESQPLRRGSTLLLHHEEQLLVYARKAGAHAVLVMLNNGAGARSVDVDVTASGIPAGAGLRTGAGNGNAHRLYGNRLRMEVASRDAVVLLYP